MAYTRKYGKKYSKRPRRVSAMDKRIAKVARKTIYRTAEKKLWITSQDEVQVDSLVQGATANWTLVNDIAAGVSAAQRTGAECRLHSLRCRGILHNNQTSGANIVRMVAGYLHDQTAPGPSTDLFLAATNTAAAVSFSGSGIPGLTACIQPLNPAKFTTLYDKTFRLGGTSSADATNTLAYDFTLNLKNRKAQYEGNVTGSGNTKTPLYILVWHAEANDDIGVGTIVEWTGSNSLYFTDV